MKTTRELSQVVEAVSTMPALLDVYLQIHLADSDHPVETDRWDLPLLEQSSAASQRFWAYAYYREAIRICQPGS